MSNSLTGYRFIQLFNLHGHGHGKQHQISIIFINFKFYHQLQWFSHTGFGVWLVGCREARTMNLMEKNL